MTNVVIIVSSQKTGGSGCVATGKTQEEAERNMHEAVKMHIEGMIEDKMPIPESASFAEYIAVAV